MSNREYAIAQIELLSEDALERVIEFISFQKWLSEDDDEYLASIKGMTESIKEGLATPVSECLDSVGWDIN
jgi:hypothetical protein